MTFRNIPLLLGIALLASGCATYQHPDFKARHARIASVAVLPSSLEVYRVTFKGDKDPMHDTAAEANQVAAGEIAAVLKNKGYTVQPFDSSEEALAKNPEVRTAWHTAKELCVKTIGDIQKGKRGKTPYSLGEEANILADHSRADSLVLLVGESVKKTGGEVTREVILWALFGTPIRPNETLAFAVLVDGNTGEILWVNKNANTGVNPSMPEQVRALVRDNLNLLPKSASKQAEEQPKKKESKGSGSPQPQNFGTKAPPPIPVGR